MSIYHIGIAGAGTMGFSMAQIFASCGYTVTLWNHREEKLNSAREKIEAAGVTEPITYTTDIHMLADMDLIVENVAENLEVKHAFYRELSEFVSDDTIIATNTSGLSINLLAQAVAKPERFLGMHWFNPPHIIPLIEIICSDVTKKEIAQSIYDLANAIGKKPAIVNRDVPGFAANRLQLAVLREALAMVEDGVITPENIDAVMKYGLGFRWAVLGPLETVDFGGIDIFYHIAEYLIPDLCDSHEIPAKLAEAYEQGKLGTKTGKGFYDYPGNRVREKTAERDAKLKKLLDALYSE